jgi:hypothetical protein
MDPDTYPDPAIFVLDLQDANKKQFFKKFFCLFHLKVHLTFKDKKVIKKSQNRRNQVFSYYFSLMIEGSRSRRSKNIRILRIRIQIYKTEVLYIEGVRTQYTTSSQLWAGRYCTGEFWKLLPLPTLLASWKIRKTHK